MGGENHGKPYFLMDDLGGNPQFLETPIYIYIVYYIVYIYIYVYIGFFQGEIYKSLTKILYI